MAGNQVDGVLGFRRGTLPMIRRPFVARTPEQADLLCWDEFCLMNLANFLPAQREGRIAVIAKGCDWRNFVVHHQEHSIDLEKQLFVLGVDCQKMIDPEKINRAAGGAERVVDVGCQDGEVRVTLIDGELLLKQEDLYRQACLECLRSRPVTADDWITEPAAAASSEHSAAAADWWSKDATERKEHLLDMFRHCLMCFSCRDACPLCSCANCFVDVEKSHWLATQPLIEGVLDFHFFRAHHIAGRCTGCGSCESACPMTISVRQLVTKLNADIEKASGYIPGLKMDADPPAGIFRPSYHELSRRR